MAAKGNNQQDIQSIYRSSLSILLGNLNLLDDFKAGKLKCVFCADTIAQENFGALFIKEKGFSFSCRKMACLKKLSDQGPYKLLYYVNY